jgi:acyl-coenzyme A thioesterase PaaI-like protein
VLSVEFKVQLLTPARGERFRATGRVVRAGRTITAVMGELRALARDPMPTGAAEGEVIAMLTGTMMAVRGRAGLVD